MHGVSGLKRALLVGGAMTTVACAADVALPGEPTVEAEVADNGDLRVAVPDGESASVAVRSHVFADEAELFQFAMDEMGGEPVYDESGALIGVRGVSVAAGDVHYRDMDTGESFEESDLARAFLGGAEGLIQVGDEQWALREAVDTAAIGSTRAALSDDSEGCDWDGDDCISGHSWHNNYYIYRSVGSETKQSRGGYGTYSYTCCRRGKLVTYQGRQQCRVITDTEPPRYEEGDLKPIPTGYEYFPTQTCSRQTTRNSLTLTVTPITPSGWPGEAATRTEANTRKVSMSAWAVGVGVDFLGIDNVAGVCGLHTGSRGSTTRTRAGDASDAVCEGNGGIFLQPRFNLN